MKLAANVFLMLMFGSISCLASLGSHKDNIESERKTLKASGDSQVKEMANYTVTSMTTAAAVINQYSNSSGQVFAVTWRGNSPPDLSVILGVHFADYRAARTNMMSSEKTRGRRPLTVKTSKIVVHHFGHMRDLRGLAYQPELVPAGVNAEVLP